MRKVKMTDIPGNHVSDQQRRKNREQYSIIKPQIKVNNKINTFCGNFPTCTSIVSQLHWHEYCTHLNASLIAFTL